MRIAPNIGIGMTLYNNAKYLPAALESLLSQTHGDFRLVLLDDCSKDETEAIAKDYASRDRRIVYCKNSKREGLVDSWHRVFHLCQEQRETDYFCWASDHDLWHSEWLASLVAELNAHRQAVLVYPLAQPIDETGKPCAKSPAAFETFGMSDRKRRLTAVCRMKGNAGNIVYGLYRVRALVQASVFSRVLVPDRFLLTELSLYGEFKQVSRILWFRRFRKKVTARGQRSSLFCSTPLYTYFPWWLTHATVLAWRLTIKPANNSEVDRLEGLHLTFLLLGIGAYRQFDKSQRKILRELKGLFDVGVRSVRRFLKRYIKRITRFISTNKE